MPGILTLALSFPSIVYTVLLGAVAIYWGFVMVGAARLGFGEGAAGHAGLGHGDAGDLGDAGEVGHDAGGRHGGGEGHAEAHGDGDGDGDAGERGGSHGVLAAMLGALKLRSVPTTVVVTGIVLFAWIFSIFGAGLAAMLPGGLGTAARLATLVVAPILALFPTSLVARPLGRLFVNPTAVARQDLVGKTCTIRTGTVTDRFGEATLDDGGAGVVVRVRVETDVTLERGQEAIIVGYDEEREEFTVAPIEELLPDSERADRRRKRAGRAGH